LRRLFSKQVVWEFIRTTLKLGAVAIVIATAWADLSRHLAGVAVPPAGVFSLLAGAIQSMLSRIAVLALAVGAADAVVARRRYLKSVKMTKQEARDEMRHSEGDPKIKGEVRRRMYRMSRMRMMAEVARATVVITNPTHFAVALRYDDESPAPIVVAKGVDHIALRIRAEAEANKVPIVEERPLARALYQSVDIGDTIPVAFYQAVAQVLAVIMRSRVAA
jgi:flagellar biosynthetic protein FlhB